VARIPRVLHLRASNFFGGPERQILRYTHLDGVDSAVASFTGDGCGAEFLSQAASRGLPVFELPAGKKTILSAIRKLTTLLKEQEVDLLCTHDYRSDIVGTIAARSAHVRCSPFLRGWTGESFAIKLFELMDRQVLRFATNVVCLSETHASEMRRQPNMRNKVRVVTNAIEVLADNASRRERSRRTLVQRFHLHNEHPIVVSAGRLSPEKGVSTFVKSMPGVLEHHPNAQFVIFGDGTEINRLQDEARRLGISTAVTFAGHVTDLSELLPGADLLVNPSFAEQVPNVVLEAMAAGVPIVATRAGSVAEIAGDPPCISLVRPGAATEISEQVNILLNDPIRRGRLRDSGIARLRLAHSPEVQRSQLLNLYREIISFAPVPAAVDSIPLLSVVIPVHNEERHIGAVLDKLLEQDYPRDRMEIIVADGNSTDRTAEVVKRNAASNVIYAPNPAQLSSAGRNVGVRKSRGNVVIFIDGHCEIPSRTLLRDTVELLATTGADCLARPQPLTSSNASSTQKAIAAARASALGHGTDSTIFNTTYEGPVDPTSSGAIYRREVFDRIGFYNEAFDACEDVEFNHRVKRAGMKCWISPKLTVNYHPRNSLGQLFSQMLRYGIGRARLGKRHPDAFTIAQLIPAIFVVTVPFGAFVSFLFPQLAPFYAAFLACYLIALIVAGVRNVHTLGLRGAMIMVGALVMIHAGLGIGFIRGLFQPRAREPVQETAPRKHKEDESQREGRIVAH
jgi:succinoglycan biosynthesis protein ExoA